MSAADRITPEEELTKLFDKHHDHVFATALSVLKNREDAEDATSQVFVRVLDQLRRGELPQLNDPRKFLTGIAYNLARDEREKRAHREHAELGEANGGAHDNQSPISLVALDLIKPALSRLPTSQQQVFVLELEGLGFREIGKRLGLGEDSVRKLALRAASTVRAELYGRVARREGEPDGCDAWGQLVWKRHIEGLPPPAPEELAAHLSSCPFCQETEAQILDIKKLGALLPLIPSDRERRRQLEAILTAARLPRRRGRLRGLVALLLLLAIPAVVADQPLTVPRPLLERHREPAPSPVAVVPTPSRSPAPSKPSPPPTPRPGPVGAVVCSGQAQGYAYLDHGGLFYRAANSASSVQLPTVGSVDNFWWSPDGRRIAYKVPASPPNIAGDVRVLDLASHSQTWQLGTAADFFTFSSDGRAWAAGDLVVQNGVLTGLKVLTAAFPQVAAEARTFTVPESEGSTGTPPTPVAFNWRDFQDQPPSASAVLIPAYGLFWQAPGIYANLAAFTVDLYDSSGNQHASYSYDVTMLDRLQGFPSTSDFMEDFGGQITRSYGGKTYTTAQPQLSGLALQMAVSSDGGTGLISVHDGGFTVDVVRLCASGSVTYLSRDGTSQLPRWQP